MDERGPAPSRKARLPQASSRSKALWMPGASSREYLVPSMLEDTLAEGCRQSLS